MWDALVAWFQSPGAARVLQTAIIPAVAILVAGVLAALIGRSAVRATIVRADRVEAAGAVAGLVEAARAASEPDSERDGRRRAARLRTESDVRTRLLTLPGASVAADWAAARIDSLLQRAADGPVDAQLDELRDRLVQWVEKPTRAKRIFGAAPVAPIPAAPAPVVSEAKSGPRRHGAAEEPAAAAETPAPAASAAPASAGIPAPVAVPAAVPVEAPAEAPIDESVPAWQRTRSGERLQFERAARTRTSEPPVEEAEQPVPQTAPVQVPHGHRAPPAPAIPTAAAAASAASAAAAAALTPAAESDEAIRLEAHQQARHARPVEAPIADDAPQAGASAARNGVPAPAWLDVYDDEAQVTQNLELKTPPPVSASAIRDRGAGEDLVPRS